MNRWVLPVRAGVGLKPDHYGAVLTERPRVGWFEVHAENYMGAGGPAHHYLEQIRSHYPLSIHGVGLSLGSDEPLDPMHLKRLKALIDRYDPEAFSEHLAWSKRGNVFFNDLLPVPYTAETLKRVIEHVDQAQETLGRRLLLENPSTYVRFQTSTMEEAEFLSEIIRRTGCGLLLDVNNVFVSATNHGYPPLDYIDRLPLDQVGEIHLAGYLRDQDEQGRDLLIDTHDRAIADEVWDLYERTLERAGLAPTLIEWDGNVPDWATLFNQVQAADRILMEHRKRGAPDAGLG